MCRKDDFSIPFISDMQQALFCAVYILQLVQLAVSSDCNGRNLSHLLGNYINQEYVIKHLPLHLLYISIVSEIKFQNYSCSQFYINKHSIKT